MKNSIIIAFLFILIGNVLSGQIKLDKYSENVSDQIDCREQKRIISDAYKYSLKNKSIDSLQSLLNSGKIINAELYSKVLTQKAYVLSEINACQFERYPSDTTTKRIVNEILEYYRLAIDTCERCKLYIQQERLYFLLKIDKDGITTKNELKDIKAKGYREEFSSISGGINYMTGRYKWIGGNITFVNFRSDSWKLNIHDSIRNKYDIPYYFIGSVDFMNFAYLRNLDQKGFDISLSFIQLTSPVHINFTKFGYQWNNTFNKNGWYYRPEIGIGWDFISVSYAYNLMFEKSLRPVSEKHLLNVKFTIPLIKSNL